MQSTPLVASRALKNREARMAIRSVVAAMKGPMHSVRMNGAQLGGHGFHLSLSTFQTSSRLIGHVSHLKSTITKDRCGNQHKSKRKE